MEGGGSSFDEKFFADLEDCFCKVDPDLMGGQDAAWKKTMEFAAAGGLSWDRWHTCQEAKEENMVKN